MKKHQILSIVNTLMFVIGFALILFGFCLVVASKDLERNIGFFLITFCPALMLLEFTKKKK